MYTTFTDLIGGSMVSIPLDETFDVDLDKVKEVVDNGKTKVIFLTLPNNPTGILFSEDTIRSLLDLGVMVVVDEAYYEFSKTTVINLVPDCANLIVLRTFSKWAGLAGLRLGYGVMDPYVAERMLVIKPPYNISIAAELAFYATIEDKEAQLLKVDKIVSERDSLFNALQSITGLVPIPSHANFILCRTQNDNGLHVYEELAKRGVFVRHYNNQYLRDYIRVSVGLPEDNAILVEALKEIL